MKILYLPLKKEWYEMIERGEKTEEYRGLSDYWKKRLANPCKNYKTKVTLFYWVKHFDLVCFSYGYTKRRMMFKCESITIGQGRKEWGAPDHNVFIIKLGERIQ